MNDYVGRYIELKNNVKKEIEEIEALELIILSEHRDDKRIKIYAPRKTYSLTDEAYEILNTINYETEITVVRRKELREFDEKIQETILKNERLFKLKLSKESIRIVEGEK